MRLWVNMTPAVLLVSLRWPLVLPMVLVVYAITLVADEAGTRLSIVQSLLIGAPLLAWVGTGLCVGHELDRFQLKHSPQYRTPFVVLSLLLVLESGAIFDSAELVLTFSQLNSVQVMTLILNVFSKIILVSTILLISFSTLLGLFELIFAWVRGQPDVVFLPVSFFRPWLIALALAASSQILISLFESQLGVRSLFSTILT